VGEDQLPFSNIHSWEKLYEERCCSAEEAISNAVRSRQRVFLEANCSEPFSLIRALVQAKGRLEEVEIIQGFYRAKACDYASPEMEKVFKIFSFHLSRPLFSAFKEGRADYIPVSLFETPRVCIGGPLPIDVAFVQLSPPDEKGYCSFGITVNYTKPIVESAKVIVAEINDQMPRTLGNTFIHVSRLNYIVEASHPLVELRYPEINETSLKIGQYVSELIPDGATLQQGIGEIPEAILQCLSNKKDLGIHSGSISDGIVDLIEKGIVTNKLKTINKGKTVVTMAMGSHDKLYRFINNNPLFYFDTVNYTHNVHTISQIKDFISINSGIQIDFTGQVNAETINGLQVSGIGGSKNFSIGASYSPGGKSIVALPSTAQSGKISRIIPRLPEGEVVTIPRGEVHYVVTEYGIAEIRGKSLRQRAEALIAIAHPQFKDELKFSWNRE
jgi:4-hydroxybutyrate CoA-transferase